MSYRRNYQVKSSKALRAVHPIWRGIGLIMLLVIPLVSFAGADLFVQSAPDFVPNWSLPRALMGAIFIPYYGTVENFGAVMVFTVVFSVTLFALFYFLNALIISLMGGDPTDKLHAPAERYKPRRKLKKTK